MYELDTLYKGLLKEGIAKISLCKKILPTVFAWRQIFRKFPGRTQKFVGALRAWGWGPPIGEDFARGRFSMTDGFLADSPLHTSDLMPLTTNS